MGAFISILSLPIIILNILGGIIGGIWLMILGEWNLVFYAILSLICSTFIISLALSPSLLFAFFLTKAIENKNFVLVYIMGILNNIWTYLVMTIWSAGSFFFVLTYYEVGNIWPYLLIGYSISTGPFAYMASKEGPDSTGSIIGVFFLCLGVIVMMISTLFSNQITFIGLLFSFSIVALIGLFVQIFVSHKVIKASKHEDVRNVYDYDNIN